MKPYLKPLLHEVLEIAIWMLFFTSSLCATAYLVFKPDAVAYECPAAWSGRTLVSSTYDGKSVSCNYIRASELYGRAVETKPAKEIR
jgi:hypothetical protein